RPQSRPAGRLHRRAGRAARPMGGSGMTGNHGAAAEEARAGFRADGLDARLVVERGTRPGGGAAFRLDVTLTVAPGEVVALLGPNGAGKTTALRALAGLMPLTEGHLRLDGVALERTPPESRPVGVVFQDY